MADLKQKSSPETHIPPTNWDGHIGILARRQEDKISQEVLDALMAVAYYS